MMKNYAPSKIARISHPWRLILGSLALAFYGIFGFTTELQVRLSQGHSLGQSWKMWNELSSANKPQKKSLQKKSLSGWFV